MLLSRVCQDIFSGSEDRRPFSGKRFRCRCCDSARDGRLAPLPARPAQTTRLVRSYAERVLHRPSGYFSRSPCAIDMRRALGPCPYSARVGKSALAAGGIHCLLAVRECLGISEMRRWDLIGFFVTALEGARPVDFLITRLVCRTYSLYFNDEESLST